MSKLKIFCIAAMLCFSAVTYATPQNIEVDGGYRMLASDTTCASKEMAMRKPFVSVMAKAGACVDSYIMDNTIQFKNLSTVTRGNKSFKNKKLDILNKTSVMYDDPQKNYEIDYQTNDILQEVDAATAELISFGTMYPGMPENEFDSKAVWQLYASGWRDLPYYDVGNRSYMKRIDSNFIEYIFYNDAMKMITISFETPSKIAADKLFEYAFANLQKVAGEPQGRRSGVVERATWKREMNSEGQYITTLDRIYRNNNYSVRISREYNKIIHSQFTAEQTVYQMTPLKGDWYDIHGNKFISITDGYINGCKVIGGFDFVGGRGQYGVYRIMENVGPKDIKIQSVTYKMIQVDDNMVLTRTPKEQYYESVNGIHLGMAYSDVLAHLGKPDDIITESNRRGLVYSDLGLNIVIMGDRVLLIRMKNNGKWFLDQSKLNYRNSISDYCKAYHFPNVPKPLTSAERGLGYDTVDGYKIAEYEYLFFEYYPDEITLMISKGY